MATRTLENLIVRDPKIHEGRPIVAGTGVTVRSITGYYRLGYTPEEIADDVEVELAGVYAALAYFHLHRDEIEADIQANTEGAVMAEFGAATRA